MTCQNSTLIFHFISPSSCIVFLYTLCLSFCNLIEYKEVFASIRPKRNIWLLTLHPQMYLFKDHPLYIVTKHHAKIVLHLFALSQRFDAYSTFFILFLIWSFLNELSHLIFGNKRTKVKH